MTPLEVSARSDGESGDEKFSLLTTLAFSINFSMGAGFLTLPFAFYESGVILGILCNLLITIPLGVSLVLVLETMARGSAAQLHEKSISQETDDSSDSSYLIKKNPSSPTTHHRSTPSNAVRIDIDECDGGSDHLKCAEDSHDGCDALLVGESKIELADLAGLFMGVWGKNSFVFFVSLYNYGCLWLYTAVFAHALALHFPLFDAPYESYVFYILVFAVLVVPCSCLDLTEQVGMQMILSLCRVVVILIMVTTSLIAFYDHGLSPINEADPAPMINISGISTILSFCAYAFLFTQGLPVLAEPARDKRQLGQIFNYTLLFMVIGYTSIGITVSLLFGSEVRASCNLMWGSYTMGGVSNFGLVLFAKLISAFVVLFPALDCLSAYPLMAIMLGNSLHVCFSNEKEENTNQSDLKKSLMSFKLLAAIPPIVGAIFVSNPAAITNYTGISGIVIGFIFPPLLSLSSEDYMLRRKLRSVTYYSTSFATSLRSYVLYLGVMLCIYVLTMNIFYPPKVHE